MVLFWLLFFLALLLLLLVIQFNFEVARH